MFIALGRILNAEKTTDKQRVTSPSAEKMSEHAADAAGLMKALGNESRLMILCMLADGERSVGDLNETIPLSQTIRWPKGRRTRSFTYYTIFIVDPAWPGTKEKN